MHTKELVNILHDEWEPFTVNKLKNTSVAWISNKFLKNYSSQKEAGTVFLDMFSYAIKETECLKDNGFNDEQSIELLAERYGGKGIGANGGGVRCGTINEYQLKGIGANCLVGNHSDVTHSYGGLDARSAICEAVMTLVLNKVLPLSAADVIGIIYTGARTAIDPITRQPCWGAILVREACIRPAHFLPAPGFLPHPNYRKKLKPDNARTRNIHRKLARTFSGPNDYILWLGKFLSNSANQLAFCKAARIMHSTLSPSNIAIDGRWLDVPLASFIAGGENVELSSNFYNEASEPLNYCMELLHTFGKANNKIFNPSPLVSYYNEQYDAYFSHHLAYMYGLPKVIGNSFPEPEWLEIKDYTTKILNSAREISRAWPKPNENDHFIIVIQALFLSLVDEKLCLKLLSNHSRLAKIGPPPIRAFKHTLQHAAKQREMDLISFSKIALMAALKRSILCGIFYLSEVDREISALCNSSSPDDISITVERYNQNIIWIFEDINSSCITILKSNKFTFSFDKAESKFLVTGIDSVSLSFGSSFLLALEYINNNEDLQQVKIHGFPIENYISRLRDSFSVFDEGAKGISDEQH